MVAVTAQSRRNPTVTLHLFGLGEEHPETLDPEMTKDGERTYLCGAYLATSHHRTTCGKPPSKESHRHGTRVLRTPSQGRSTVARSTSWGTRAPARGPAAVPLPFTATTLDLASTRLGKLRRG
jgi:hypothetical protein